MRAVAGVAALVLALAVLALVLGTSTGTRPTGSGRADPSGGQPVWSLRPGDCYDLVGGGAVSRATTLPCSQAHHYEVFFTGAMTGTDYPAETDLGAWVRSNCGSPFAAYVGKAVEASDLAVYYFVADRSAWASGERSIQCSIADTRLNPLTISLKGSGR